MDTDSRPHDLRTAVHDLRNVIAPLRNAVQLLRMRGNADAGLAPITDIIERQVNEMVRMLNVLAGIDQSAQPCSASSAQRPPAADSPAPAGRRVLIVDDNVALLESLSGILREAGHSVQTAEDGVPALALAASWRPEFVLLDAQLPHMNGFEVAKQLRAAYSPEDMTLVLMTGSSLDEAMLHGAERAGFDHCIDKINSFAALDNLLRERR